jgi:hypothetical protein
VTRRGALLAVAVLASAATQVACGGADNASSAGPADRRASEPSPRPTQTSPKRTDDMNITLSFDDTELTATLVDSETTQDFLSLLPLTLTLSDYNETERITDLPRRLSTAGAPEGVDPGVGDITYYAPWGNLAIFYRDFDYSPGLVTLGRIDAGIEALAGSGGDVTVTITRSDEPAD